MTAPASTKKMTVYTKIVPKAISIKRCLERSVKIIKQTGKLLHAKKVRGYWSGHNILAGL